MNALVKSAELTLLLPSGLSLYGLAVGRCSLAHQYAAMRALEMRGVVSTSDLSKADARVIGILQQWALPLPPPSVTDQPLRDLPIDLDLSEEAFRLMAAKEQYADPHLAFSSFSVVQLEEDTGACWDVLIEEVFRVNELVAEALARGAVPSTIQIPDEELVRLSRARASFVSRVVALNSLCPAASVGELPAETRQVLLVIDQWGAG